MVILTREPIDVPGALSAAFHLESGAVVSFVGTVRDENEIAALEYEAYDEMARKRLEEIVGEAVSRWGLKKALLVHRLGRVSVGEASLLIAVSSPHRGEAFEACRWILESLKKDVPIWKKEVPGSRGGRGRPTPQSPERPHRFPEHGGEGGREMRGGSE